MSVATIALNVAQTTHTLMPEMTAGDIAGAAAWLLEQACKSFDDDLTAARICVMKASALLRGGRDRTGAAESAEPKRGGLAPWQINRVVRHIDDNLEQSIPVEALASIARLSRSYFLSAFKRSMGVSPHTFVLNRRIERAKEMMLETDEPLTEIALACGYCDQAHLSRLFRRATGETPKAWRRAWYGGPSVTQTMAGVQ